MAAAYVRDTGKVSGAGVSSIGLSFGTAPAVNNHVVAGCSAWNDPQITSITWSDNKSNSWAQNVSRLDPPAGTSGAIASIGSAKVATSGGTFTVTVAPNLGSGNYIEAVAAEYSGLDTTTHLDKTGNNQWTAGTSVATVTASAANSQADALVFAVLLLDAGDSNLNITTPTTGYSSLATQQDSNTTIGFNASYKVVSSNAAADSAAWNHDLSRGAAVIATYKAASGGASPISLNAGANTVTITNPATSFTLGGVNLNAGQQLVTITNPAVTLSLISLINAGAQTVLITAPTGTLQVGAVNLTAGGQLVTIDAPTAVLNQGGTPQSISAGAQVILITAPNVSIDAVLNLPGGQQLVTFTNPAGTVSLGAVTIPAGTQLVTISNPNVTVSGGAPPTAVPAGDGWIFRWGGNH